MHAGELADYRNPRDAMVMGVQRIGHGVKLQDDLIAIEYARRQGVGITCCLVSNYVLGAWTDYSTHPFLKYLRLGIPVSLSTDDEGMLGTDISRECREAVSNTNVQYSELLTMSRNSIIQSFAGQETKAALLKKLDGDIKAFESDWTLRSFGDSSSTANTATLSLLLTTGTMYSVLHLLISYLI